jgi:hypothetical protein
VAGFRVLRIAEAQRVEVCDRPRAHREDIAHDAADAGRSPLIRLDVGWMVVAFHLEDGAVAIAQIDDARVLARALDHLRPLVGSVFSQMRLDLYEQCSDHITEKMPSSVALGCAP